MAEKWEKKYTASSRKRGRARRKGQFPKSQDASNAVVLAAFLLVLPFAKTSMWAGLTGFFEEMFTSLTVSIGEEQGVFLLRKSFVRALSIAAPVLTGVVAGALAVGVYQTGGLSFSTERIQFDITKLNPVKGFGRIFSTQGLMKLGTSLLKLATIASVLAWTILPRIPEIMQLGQKGVSTIIATISWILFQIILRVTLALIFLALIDRAYQKWKYERDLKMTHEERKEDLKSTEGNPKTKKRILEMQRKIMLQRMFQNTEMADVVVTNPQRLAVALRYAQGEMGAPRVVAKGMNRVAARIREIARNNGIPVIENKPLARSLYQMCAVGMEIPEKLYRPVAELLAYVFKLRKRRQTRGNQV